MPTNDLLTLVREKQAQIAKLQAELDEVRQLLLGRSPTEPTTPRPRGEAKAALRVDHLPGIPVGTKRGKRRRRGRESSVTLAAAVVGGESVHVDDMIQRIGKQFGKEIDKQTLVSNLARLVKTGEWERTAPNTFRKRTS